MRRLAAAAALLLAGSGLAAEPRPPGGASFLVPTLREASGRAVVMGVVRHERGPLRVKDLTNTQDVATCGAKVRLESIVEGQGGTLGNVVVEVRPLEAERASATPLRPERRLVSIERCLHVPHVVVIPAGSRVEVANPDGILHRLFASCVRNPAFEVDLPRYRRRAIVSGESLARPERIEITCDVHPFMKGWWVVTDAPFHALTQRDGQFRITGLQPGRWIITTWHEDMGELEQELDLRAQEATAVDLVYR